MLPPPISSGSAFPDLQTANSIGINEPPSHQRHVLLNWALIEARWSFSLVWRTQCPKNFNFMQAFLDHLFIFSSLHGRALICIFVGMVSCKVKCTNGTIKLFYSLEVALEIWLRLNCHIKLIILLCIACLPTPTQKPSFKKENPESYCLIPTPITMAVVSDNY